jgi:type I restriction enzyme M protein
MKPDPRVKRDFTICDPACGTVEFLVAAYEWLMKQTKDGALDRDTAKRVKKDVYFGQELVARPRRLALMNLVLHGLEPHIKLGDSIYEVPDGRDRCNGRILQRVVAWEDQVGFRILDFLRVQHGQAL